MRGAGTLTSEATLPEKLQPLKSTLKVGAHRNWRLGISISDSGSRLVEMNTAPPMTAWLPANTVSTKRTEEPTLLCCGWKTTNAPPVCSAPLL